MHEGKRAWAEISREALCQNLFLLKKELSEGCRVMPAVKANAYGHGAAEISRLLQQMGVWSFSVASAWEGAELRRVGIQGEILVLGYTPEEELPLLKAEGLTQAVVDEAYAGVLCRYGKSLAVHLAIDTGMHRLGVQPENAGRTAGKLLESGLHLAGVFSHLCAADSGTPEDIAFTHGQAELFYETLRKNEITCPAHLLGSDGILRYPQYAGNLVRPGIALYGYPGACLLPFRPVLSLKAAVAAVRVLPRGAAAGYGQAFHCRRDTRLAVIAIGYGDGVPRNLSGGRGEVLLHGRRAKIAGRICMDQLLADVTDIPETAPGDTAVLLGKSGEEEITAYDWAQLGETIPNEILSRLGQRPARVVVG